MEKKLFNEITQLITEEAGSTKHIHLEQDVKTNFFLKRKGSATTKKGESDIMRKNVIPPEKRVDCSSMSLDQMREEVAKCKRCRLCESRTNTVFGEGDSKAKLLFIGEGPGRDEDEQGKPFVGRSGQLLTKMINAMGYEREDVYIANIVKCRPPSNRAPLPDEAETCLPFILRQIELINPKVIVLLGAVPLKYLLNKTGITKIHGEWFDFMGIKTIPSFHPAFLLRDPSQKKFAWEDLQKAMKVLGK